MSLAFGKQDYRGNMASGASRSHVLKAIRRFLRTIRTEWRLFIARPMRKRPWTGACIGIFVCALLVTIFLAIVYKPEARSFIEHGNIREATHFTHNAQIFLLPQRDWDRTRLPPCSWLYLEVNAGDGRHMDAFFKNGNQFLEEYLRAVQASMRGFCAVAFEPDPQMAPALRQVRRNKGRKARRFDVFAGIVFGADNDTETIALREHYDSHDPQNSVHHGEQRIVEKDHYEKVKRLPLLRVISQLTFPLEQSGHDGRYMSIARANGNNGTVIMRLNAAVLKEAYWYMQVLDSSPVLCDRVDRLILNLQPLAFDSSSQYLIDRQVIRDWAKLLPPISDDRFDYRRGIDGLVDIAREVNAKSNCRTMVYVIDNNGKKIFPPLVSERGVFYSILAGYPTFDERISAQTSSWMTAVPMDRVGIYTNIKRNADELQAARGRTTIVTKPHLPQREGQLDMMQSWSHLVRVRETWDRFMKDDPSIKWLALVDDDTFVFPGGFREYLSGLDPRRLVWGGSGEQARIDNGDHGEFAYWLRNLSRAHGGKHCYMPHEDIPARLRGVNIKYGVSDVMNGRRVAKIVSHMCGDTFCRRGCPAVPQGATIFLSRALVEALRPMVEKCEEHTLSLCKNCGSQRLYMCVNRFVSGGATLMTRGVCRAPWKLERRDGWPFAITYHGFTKYRGLALSTGSIQGDMEELWQLGKAIEERTKAGYLEHYYVPMQQVADLIGCRGQGTYVKGSCMTKEGIRLEANDGSPKKHIDRPGHRPADRHGSA